MDVFVGQVRGPEDALALALIEFDANGELVLLYVGVRGVFVELGGSAAVAADAQIAEPDVDALGIDLGAGVADGGDQTAPIGIRACPGRFYQWRVRDGFGDT